MGLLKSAKVCMLLIFVLSSFTSCSLWIFFLSSLSWIWAGKFHGALRACFSLHRSTVLSNSWMLVGNWVWGLPPSTLDWVSSQWLTLWDRLSHKKSDCKPETKCDRERGKNKSRDMKRTSSGKEVTETKTARDESVRKTSSVQEIFIPVKMSSVILIPWFSSPILETSFWLPTVRVWGTQRTSERFQHASLSITQILYRNSLLVLGYKNKHRHSSTCLDEKEAG